MDQTTRRRLSALGTLVLMALGALGAYTLLNPGWWSS